MDNRSAPRARVRTIVATVAILTGMTAALVAAAAIADISIVAALLAAAAISGPIVVFEVRAARLTQLADRMHDDLLELRAVHDLAAEERRELLRALGNSRMHDRHEDGIVGLVMQKMAGHTGSVNTRLDMIAEAMDKALASAFTNGYVKGMAVRRDPPDDPPRLRSV